MFRRYWITPWGGTTGKACFFSVLMLLSGCDPTVRDVWLTGIQGAMTGLVGVLTSLLTTAITAWFTTLSNDGDGITTVEAVFEYLVQAIG